MAPDTQLIPIRIVFCADGLYGRDGGTGHDRNGHELDLASHTIFSGTVSIMVGAMGISTSRLELRSERGRMHSAR
jgi:hypothetical protein